MNISFPSLENHHFPVMLNEVIKSCSPYKKGLVVDCTFGGGGYSKELLMRSELQVIALDRDESVKNIAQDLKKKYQNKFIFFREKFSNLDKILSEDNKADVIIFDLGLSTMQLEDYKRGFSFKSKEKIDMQMGLSATSAEEIINKFDEQTLKSIIKNLGEEKEAGKIARNIIKFRQDKNITTVPDLVAIIERSKKKDYNKKINICTKTFQALRIFVNKEISELIEGLIKASKFVKQGGKIIVISFHSIEDKIVKYFFTNYSSNKSRPSRYLPIEEEKNNILFEDYFNDFFEPSVEEISKNPASRSAKLRFVIRKKNAFIYPENFKIKFRKYLDLENA